MASVTGSSSRANSPSNIELVGPLTAGRLAFLVAIGVAIALLHETIRYPLRIPGQHGLEGMALLALARYSTTYKWGATIAALSSAGTAAAMGAGSEWTAPFLYLAPGIALDLGVMLFAGWRTQFIVLPLVTAFAFATKPLIRLGLMEVFGMQFGSFRAGVLYPISTHIAFGFMGALMTAIAWRMAQKRFGPPERST
ncbi:MAG: hypothetical protein K2Q28_10540 [Hyphomicrobium sp.]|nr:hypothetical protein [Hyphomicrobium sp.]